FEYVREVWSRCWSDAHFRETWRSSERQWRLVLRDTSRDTTRVTYHLTQAYCAAGHIDTAASTAAAAARSAPGDTDALALAVIVRQFRQQCGDFVRRFEVAARLPDGSGPAMLG
ncbi:hypothetical protein Agub_g8589, partial [Astrephomene gubernaculifera]